MKEKVRNVPLLDCIDKVFEADIKEDFLTHYVKKHGGNVKWLIASDYQFDPQFHNVIITYSCFSYNKEFSSKLSDIRSTDQREIKKVRKIRRKYLVHLQKENVFSVSFILPKNKYIFWENQKDAKVIILDTLLSIESQIKDWEERKTGDPEYYESLKRKIKIIKNDLNGNKKIKEGIRAVVTSLLSAYICAKIALIFQCEVVGWFSDRDSVNDVYENISKDLSHINFNALVEPLETKFVVAGATSGSGNWYEELVLLPDLITGALSNFDSEKNESKTKKHHEIMRHLLVKKKYNAYVIRVSLKNASYTANRVVYNIHGISNLTLFFFEDKLNLIIEVYFRLRKFFNL
ncbi:hypothetical protein [Leptospira stimsonii]|uniref:Uncharacterized protein n=1 Tax=Leptospira stimsonii TaxID=2202203 RepID=A0A8B3CJX0_9LEPT|nr:hypothetical protein [Leptospira stimsonii]RHX83580.1 hypothetical protein DLM78_21565 [Leptospira stimsonii]